MKTWKALAAATALIACSSTSYATVISLQDTMRFESTKLDGFGDSVTWTHSFDFIPPAETVLNATLGLKLYDDDDDFRLSSVSCGDPAL